MSGILYSADIARTKIATYENGVVSNLRHNTIGQYDTTGNYKFIYCGLYKINNNKIGHVHYNNGYLNDSNSIFIYTKNGYIYSLTGELLARYEGDADGALAAYIICHYEKVKHYSSVTKTAETPTPVSTNPNSVNTGSYSSDNVGTGGIAILLMILACPLVIWLGWKLSVLFWSDFLMDAFEQGNAMGLIFCYGVIIFCSILGGINAFKKAESKNVFQTIGNTFKVGYEYIGMGVIVGIIALIIEIIVTKTGFFIALLTIPAAFVFYYLFALFPLAIVSVITAVCVLFKE